MTKQEQDAVYYSGMHLLAISDNGLEVKQLERAIEDIKLLIYTRQNVPF